MTDVRWDSTDNLEVPEHGQIAWLNLLLVAMDEEGIRAIEENSADKESDQEDQEVEDEEVEDEEEEDQEEVTVAYY